MNSALIFNDSVVYIFLFKCDTDFLMQLNREKPMKQRSSEFLIENEALILKGKLFIESEIIEV
jgi:hypothetical protein